MLESVEKLRKKLEEDTAGDFVFTTYPEQHGFKVGVTVEGYEAIADEIEREVAERYMPLPLDADGVPIRVGDEMERMERRGKVIALHLSNNPWGEGNHWAIQLEGEHAPTVLDAFFHHHHEPTVEDVLREVVAEVQLGVNEVPHIVTEYAKRLRLAGDGE